MIGWLGSVLGGFLGKIWAPLFQWWAAYRQGRNAERAEQAEARADESAKLADAHARVRDVIVDDDWLHRGSPAGKAPTSTSTG